MLRMTQYVCVLGVTALAACATTTVPLGGVDSTDGAGAAGSPAESGGEGAVAESGGEGAISDGNAAGTASATSGEFPSGDTGVSICPGDSQGAPMVDLSTVKMGDECVKNSCEPGGCASFGMTLAGTTTKYALLCADHRLQAIASTLLDSTDGNWTQNPSTSWSDCDSALSDGHSGDTCTWSEGACSRQTDDPCCIEVATCQVYNNPDPSVPAGGLFRFRVCAPGCQALQPNPAQPTITDCSDLADQDICSFGPSSCQAGLVCTRGSHSGLSADVAIDDASVDNAIDTVAWCANGVLVGGYFLAQGDIAY